MAASASSHGILNPKGIGWSLASVGYFAAIPVSSWLAQPNYVVEKSLALLLQVGSASSASTSGAALISDKAKAIPALSVLYLFVTYAASAATSVAAQAMGREEGLDGSEPRRQLSTLTGLPLRLRSAHQNLIDTFPAFALCAALSYTSLLSSSSLLGNNTVASPAQQHVINLLGLHVLLKVFVYLPAYIGDLFPLRGPSHILSIGALGAVCWRLAGGHGDA